MHAPTGTAAASSARRALGGAGDERRAARHRPAALASARAAVERELDAIDRACSRFRADSELSRVNARGGRWVHVGPLLLQALELALRAAALTDGDVDPTVGRALELAGYDRDWSLLRAPPTGGPLGAPAVTVRGCAAAGRRSRLDRASASVRVPAAIRLDLGATAKAWAADRAAAAAAPAAAAASLVSIGGDIATAGAPPAGGWRDPRDRRPPQRRLRSRARRSRSARAGSPPRAPPCAAGATAGRPCTTSSTPPPARPCAGLAHGQRRRGQLRGRQHRHHRGARAGEHAPAWLAAQALPARLVDQRGEVLTLGGWPAEGAAQLGAERTVRRRWEGSRGMSFVLAGAAPSAYWYLTRSTGAVALILLTAAIALGVADVRRLELAALAALHDRRRAPQRVAAGDGVPRGAHPHLRARQLRADLC